jgi:hypothetical protein
MAKKTDAIATRADAPIEFVVPVESIHADQFEGMTIEQTVSLEDGQSIGGIFRGEGTGVTAINTREVDSVNQETGEVTKRTVEKEVPLKTWLIEVAPNQVAALVSSAQLDTKMPGVPPGSVVRIARLGSGKTRRGNQITRYVVGFKAPGAE